GAGMVKYRLDAASYFDPFGGETTFIKAHIARILAYPPFGDRYTALAPTLAYHDAFTTWGAHSLNPTHRAEYVAFVKRDREHGYAGQFMDDLEWENSGQNEPGTNAEILALIEAVRGALGPAGLLELNTQYVDLRARLAEHNATVEKALTFVNQIDKEFGVSTPSGITSPSSYASFFSYVDTLHGKGIHIDLLSAHPYEEFPLATYLLLNDGGDFIGAHMIPSEWWSGFEENLGEATSPREVSGNLYERHFTGGGGYAQAPGGGAPTLAPGETTHPGHRHESTPVTHRAGQGAP